MVSPPTTPTTEKKVTRKPQTLSGKWLADPVKSKYVSGNVGDKDFLCKACQVKYSCESFYDHLKWHQSKA